MQLVENNKNNSVNTKQITDITEVLEKTKRSWVDETDVSGYKWKLVSDNQNEPTQVHFYKEDTNDTLSVSLSSIFDYQLKEYLHNLIEEEDNEKQRLEEESRQYKQDIMDEKLDEFMESYELFIKQQVKNEISKQDIKPNLTNIRKMVDEFSKNHSGIHYGFGNRRMNSISIQKEWYLENYEKLSQIVLSIDPEHKPSSEKYEKNKYGIRFMLLDNMNLNHNYFMSARYVVTMFYEKLNILLRKMNKSKIGYWYSQK